MTALVIAGAGVLGGFGALARFLVDSAVSERFGRGFPLGTLVVNLSGSFVLGFVVGAALSGDSLRFAGTGFLGAYTTFSTWAFESHRLAGMGERRPAAINFGVSLALGIAATWLGRELGELF